MMCARLGWERTGDRELCTRCVLPRRTVQMSRIFIKDPEAVAAKRAEIIAGGGSNLQVPRSFIIDFSLGV